MKRMNPFVIALLALTLCVCLTACSGGSAPAEPAAPTEPPQTATPEPVTHAPGEEYDVRFYFMIGNTNIRQLPKATFNGVEYYKYTDAIVNGAVAQPLLIETGLVGNGTTGNMMPAKVCVATRAMDADNGDVCIVTAVDENAFGPGGMALNIAGATNYRDAVYADGQLTIEDKVWNITGETNVVIGTKFVMTPDFDLFAENGELPEQGHCVAFPMFDDPDTAQFVVVNTYSNFNAPRQAAAAPSLPPVPQGLDMSFTLTPEHIDTEKAGSLGFWLYTPAGVEENMPMILYLHGGGIKGNDLESFYNKCGITGYLAEGRIHVPAYVAIPQLPGNKETWADIDEALAELVEYMIATYDVDPARVNMVGESMGGIGTFDMATRYPELFDRVVPISGIEANTEANLKALENMHVWCFVGSADTIVTTDKSVPFMEALMERNPNARLTVVEGATHGQVGMKAIVLDEYGVLDWLLADG